MSNITLIGIDLAKSVFQLCGMNKARHVQFNKQVSRAKFVDHVRQHSDATLVMKACSSAHHWARTFIEMGFTVRLIPAQHVKAFYRGKKYCQFRQTPASDIGRCREQTDPNCSTSAIRSVS